MDRLFQRLLILVVIVLLSFLPALASSLPSVGDTMSFGGYTWRVLEVRDGAALLLTDVVIEANLYSVELTDVTWETCFLRSYLNDRFLQNFTAEERERIIETSVSNPDNLWYGTAGGADTLDKVFLLSLEEADRYFGDSGDYHNARRVRWGAQGIEIADDGWALSNEHDDERTAILGYGFSWWWLRSPGSNNLSAAAVSVGGDMNVRGRDVDAMHPDMGGVRPAIWLKLE